MFPVNTDPRETSLDPWHVTGLVEGEGSFTFSRSGTRRQNFSLFFAIKMSGDEGLLDAVQAFFGTGAIYPAGPGARLYRVSDLRDLESVVAHFDTHPLRGPKKRAFRVWREMVALKRDSFRRPPIERLEALAANLTAASPRNRRRVVSRR